MIKNLKLIKETFVGSYLSDNDIIDGLETGDFIVKQFKKGQIVHLESEECHSMEILLAGDIVCLQLDEFGNEHIINYIAKGEIIAGNILFGTSPKYPLNFLARSNIMLLQINKNYMLNIFVHKPQILRQFLRLISDRAINLGSKMKLAKRVTHEVKYYGILAYTEFITKFNSHNITHIKGRTCYQTWSAAHLHIQRVF